MSPGACILTLGLAVVVQSSPHAPAAQVEPVISVWYRGTPAGVPQQDDLAVIRALGFSSVTWPEAHAGAVADLRRMAEVVGLSVLTRGDSTPLTPRRARRLSDDPAMPIAVDVAVTDVSADAILALVWRAVAAGTRVVSFDPGQAEGLGVSEASGRPAPWVAPAVRLSRHLANNVEFISLLKPGPALSTMLRPPPDFSSVLLDSGRAWLLVATNLSATKASTIVRLPVGVPYGLWVNLLDGTDMSMLATSAGPRWSVSLPPWGVFVYVIDKGQK